jgi:selenocysteine-specific elongation factor
VVEGLTALPDFAPRIEGGEAAVRALVARLEGAGLEPPSVTELAAELGIANPSPLLRQAVELGAITQVERDRFFAARALAQFRQTLAEIGSGGPITPGSIRERLGLSRKYIIPLLEWADRRGVTRRQGDVRRLVDSGS